MKKKCSKCGKRKPTDQFHIHKRNKDGLYYCCKSCKKEVDKVRWEKLYYDPTMKKQKKEKEQRDNRRYLKNRKYIMRFKQFKGCCCCKEKEPVVLEFHHLDQSKKHKNVTSMSGCNIDKIKNEIRKCVVICANCHRKLHAGILALPRDCGNGSTKPV